MLSFGYEQLTCYKAGCHAAFAVPAGYTARFRETAETFFCPFGHQQCFPKQAQHQDPPREVVMLRQEVEVCRRRNITAEHKASLAERRLAAARTGHAFLENGKWRGLCPSCFAEQPRGGKKAGARRWGKMHCASPVIPTVQSVQVKE